LARLVNVSAGKEHLPHFGQRNQVVAGLLSLFPCNPFAPSELLSLVKPQTGTSGYSLQQHWSLKKYKLF
jgi:hypothetical protein